MIFKYKINFLRNNFLLVIFILGIIFVGFISLRKSVVTKSHYIYAKVKMGQGLWWATTEKPSNWLANSIDKGDIQYDLLGNPKAEVIEVRKYPTISSNKELNLDGEVNRYEVYLIVKLKVDYDSKTKSYTFDRSNLSIGSSIEIQLPKVDVSGTVMDLSSALFRYNYQDKIVYLIDKDGYRINSSNSFDSLMVGDEYFDGEDFVLKVLDKSLENQDIVVRAKIRVKENNGELIYGEDFKLVTNAFIPFSTNKYYFKNFIVGKIE